MNKNWKLNESENRKKLKNVRKWKPEKTENCTKLKIRQNWKLDEIKKWKAGPNWKMKIEIADGYVRLGELCKLLRLVCKTFECQFKMYKEITGVVSFGKSNSSSEVDQSSTRCKARMRKSSGSQHEKELRVVFQGVLMCSLKLKSN